MRLGRFRDRVKAHLNNEPVVDRPVRTLLFLAALYHDIGKPETSKIDENGKIRFIQHEKIGADIIRKRAASLHLSNVEINRLEVIIKHHMRPSLLSHEQDGPSKRAIYRFFRDTGEAGIDICLLSLADLKATYGPTLSQERWSQQIETVRAFMEAWWETPSQHITPPPLINGRDLLNHLGIAPGPRIGEILEAIQEAQVEDKIHTRDEALVFAGQYDSRYKKE